MAATQPETLGDLLDSTAARGQAPAVIAIGADGAPRLLTSAALAARAREAAGDLLRSGVGPGQPVALVAPNSPEWIVAFFAILAAGALPVLLDCQARPRDLAQLLIRCGARRVLAAGDLVSTLRQEWRYLNPLAGLNVTPVGDLATTTSAGAARDELPGLLPKLRPTDTAVIFYTSGTTGSPKGVPLTHQNLLANVRALVALHLVGPGDRLLLPLPLHHAYPFTCGLLGCLATGATLVLPATVTGPGLTGALRGTGATVLLGVPRLYTALLTGLEARARAQAPGKWLFGPLQRLATAITRRTGLHAGRWLFRPLHREMGPKLRLLVCGGAPLETATAWRLEGLGWRVLSGYGLSETAPILTLQRLGRVRHETVGEPLPGVQLRIDAPAGQGSGEVLARGPNVFAGYLDQPDATAAAFTPDGWFRTGDLGFLDQQGYLHLVGRVKETIVLPDGKKLVPEQVEAAYGASPLIRELALLEQDGQLVALVVPDEARIRDRGAARLARLLREELEAIALGLPAWQRVSDYRLADGPLPRTPMGKLQRFRLPALYQAAESGRPVATARELSADDRALLATPTGTALWQWLKTRFPGQSISLDTRPQFDLQVDSLEWVALTLEINDRVGVTLSQDAVARVLTLRDLLREVTAAAGAPSRLPAPGPGAAVLSRPPLHLRVLARVLYGVNKALMKLIFRLRIEGLEHLPSRGPLVLAPNHASYLDPLALAAALPWRLLGQVHWAGWTVLMYHAWHWRLLSRATRVFPVDPDHDPAGALAAGRAVLAADEILVWFPEGRRSLTGELGPFLPGIGVLLRESGSPAVPVHIGGSFAALPWNRRWPRPARITLRFGPAVTGAALEAGGTGDDPASRVAAGLRAAMAALIPVANHTPTARS